MDDELLVGGVNEVTRRGDTVLRPTGLWTPAVHALLHHLAAVGFAGAPRAYGIDDAGREILEFVPGDVPNGSAVESDATLVAVAGLLRAYHDATTTFVPQPDARWYFPARVPGEVICHGDVAPYNTVFRSGMPVAFIDFDTAHPAQRVWDVAYAAYRFVPLTLTDGPAVSGQAEFEQAVSEQAVSEQAVSEQARRLRLFCDAYGLGAGDRAILLETVRARLDHLVRHMTEQAAAGHVAFATHLAEGHDRLYRADSAYIAERQTSLAQGL